jgi:hypothetical protein
VTKGFVCALFAGRVVLNEFATPPQGMLAYAQQVRFNMV